VESDGTVCFQCGRRSIGIPEISREFQNKVSGRSWILEGPVRDGTLGKERSGMKKSPEGEAHRRADLTAAVCSYKMRQSGIIELFTSWKPVQMIVSYIRKNQKPTGWDLAQFFRQLSVLMKAGISPIRCLDICAQQTSNHVIREKIQILSAEIRGGSRFSQAMRQAKGVFNEFHAGAIQSFEVIGDLGHVFENLAMLEEKNYTTQQRLKSVLTYPTSICIISLIGLFCLVKFLLPLVNGVVSQSNRAIPWPTQVLMWIGNVMENPLMFLSLAVITACMVYLIRWIFSAPKLQVIWDSIRFRLPYIGSVLRSSMVVQISRSISALMASNLPLTSSIELTSITCGSPYLKEKVLNPAVEYMRRGESFSQAVGGQKIFPRSFHGMVAVGEKTGHLPDTLLNIANIYEMELNVRIEVALRAIEPVVLFFVGGLVLLVMVCAFMPLYESLGGMSSL